jgi:hypothetical protein
MKSLPVRNSNWELGLDSWDRVHNRLGPLSALLEALDVKFLIMLGFSPLPLKMAARCI